MIKISDLTGIVFIILTILVLNLSSSVYSQQKKPLPEERITYLKGLLGLTDDQARQVSEILEKLDVGTATEPRGGQLNKRELTKSAQNRRAETDKEIEALLTSEQQQKYATYKKTRRGEFDTQRKSRSSEKN